VEKIMQTQWFLAERGFLYYVMQSWIGNWNSLGTSTFNNISAAVLFLI